jgi:hypothetical protein
MPVGEVDIHREVLNPVTPDSDDVPALPGWERVSSPALIDDATFASRQDRVGPRALGLGKCDRASKRGSGPTGTIVTSRGCRVITVSSGGFKTNLGWL